MLEELPQPRSRRLTAAESRGLIADQLRDLTEGERATMFADLQADRRHARHVASFALAVWGAATVAVVAVLVLLAVVHPEAVDDYAKFALPSVGLPTLVGVIIGRRSRG